MNDHVYQQKILDEVRIFAAKEIQPHATEFDENEAIPDELIAKMAANGYLFSIYGYNSR